MGVYEVLEGCYIHYWPITKNELLPRPEYRLILASCLYYVFYAIASFVLRVEGNSCVAIVTPFIAGQIMPLSCCA